VPYPYHLILFAVLLDVLPGDRLPLFDFQGQAGEIDFARVLNDETFPGCDFAVLERSVLRQFRRMPMPPEESPNRLFA
jgi:hypothetical protein